MNLDKNIIKEYKSLFGPLAVEQIFMMLIANVNVFLISLYTDEAVAATGLADQVLSIGTMFMGIVSLGSSIVFLQNADSKNLPIIESAFRSALVLNLILALILIFVTTVFGDLIMRLMQAPMDIRLMSVRYLRIVGLSFVFQGISGTIRSLLRSFGHVKTAMKLSITITLITIVGNALVVLTPIRTYVNVIIAIAMATVVSRAIGAIISISVLRGTNRPIWDHILSLQKNDLNTGKKILSLGIPSGMENVSYIFSQTIIASMIAGLGTVALTSKIYTQAITPIVFTLAVAAGQTIQILLARLLRSNKLAKARVLGLDHARLVVLLSAGINLAIALLSPLLIRIFTSDPDIIRTSRVLIWMSIFYDPFRSANEVLIASLNLVGQVSYPVKLAILTTYLFTIPAILLSINVLGQGINAVWLIFIIDEGIRAGLFYRKWSKGEWILTLGERTHKV